MESDKETKSAASNGSRDNSTNQLLETISKAIFDRIGPIAAGTLKQEGQAELAPIDEGFIWLRVTPQQISRLLGSSPAEADLAATVAMFPAGMHALITARVDARIVVSRSADSLQVAISQSSEPQFLFRELSKQYDATHALHLVCDPAKDAGYTYVMVEFSGGKFAPSGWLDGETAARYAAEGAKSATGRPPDFYGATGKLPK